jgi:hypothetical protein
MASFTQVSPNNPVRPSLPLYLPNAPTHLTLLIQSPSNIQSAVLTMQLLTVHSPAVNCFPVPLSHKYLPQHSILKHPQFMFLSQYTATSVTAIYKQANYISPYIKFIYFDNKMKKYVEKMEMK